MSKLTKSWLDKTRRPFDSTMLKVGEIMEITEGEYSGEIAIKMNNQDVYSLNDSCKIYNKNSCIGRKLQPGESITLTQE